MLSPEGIEDAIPCGGELGDFQADNAAFGEIVGGEKPPSVSYEDVDLPDPGPQENMPDAATAPAAPAGPPPSVDVASIGVPDRPA